MLLFVFSLLSLFLSFFFFFNHTATTEIYTLSLHDALPISRLERRRGGAEDGGVIDGVRHHLLDVIARLEGDGEHRSEEHTSELQSRLHLVCRLLLEKKKKKKKKKNQQVKQ